MPFPYLNLPLVSHGCSEKSRLRTRPRETWPRSPVPSDTAASLTPVASLQSRACVLLMSGMLSPWVIHLFLRGWFPPCAVPGVPPPRGAPACCLSLPQEGAPPAPSVPAASVRRSWDCCPPALAALSGVGLLTKALLSVDAQRNTVWSSLFKKAPFSFLSAFFLLLSNLKSDCFNGYNNLLQRIFKTSY